MILNAFLAIVAGWGFQLNGDVTGKLCRKNIYLVEFGVDSIPWQAWQDVHVLGCNRVANESVAIAFFEQAVPMLLAELAADELTKGADELCEAS
jgi:hypothetical protein